MTVRRPDIDESVTLCPMVFDPGSPALQALFRDPSMFDSSDRWQKANFQVVRRSSETKIMVASHVSVPGYLFKKYVNDISLDDQLKNYERRVEGSEKVRSFIADRDLRRIVVPRKWLYELPSNFGSRKESDYVLIVERLELLDDEEAKREYGRIDAALLEELCIVLYKFRGLDSIVKNVPITRDGRIAFVDTEHWDRHKGKDKDKKPFLKYIGEYLTSDSAKLARKLFNKLDD